MKNKSASIEKEPFLLYKFSQQKGIVASVAIVLMAYGLFLCYVLFSDGSLLFVLAPGLFLLAGFFYQYILSKKLLQHNSRKRWTYTAVLSVLLLLLLSASPWLGFPFPWRQIMAAVSAFLLPFVLSEFWRLQVFLSYSDVMSWQLTQEASTDFPSIYLNGLQVRFKVIQGSKNDIIGPVTFLASGRMMLGDVFHDMVLKQANKGLERIELKSRKQEPYTWVFYTPDTWLWNRALDPKKSLIQNKLKKDTLIYAERISKEAFPTNTNKEVPNVVSL